MLLVCEVVLARPIILYSTELRQLNFSLILIFRLKLPLRLLIVRLLDQVLNFFDELCLSQIVLSYLLMMTGLFERRISHHVQGVFRPDVSVVWRLGD